MEIIRSSDLKEVSEPWGVSIVLLKNEEKSTEIGLFRCDPAKSMDLHTHDEGDEIIYVLKGKGNFRVQSEEAELSEGSAVFIPKNVEHRAFNKGPREYWCLYIVSPLR